MKHRILCVDDEISILAWLQAALGKRFDVIPAPGPADALATIDKSGPFAVIISDLNMPGLSGVEFLTKVRTLAPDSVRMLFTGYAELQIAISAVNEGNVFRFLTKPCSTEAIIQAIQAGVEQHLLITAEKELLEKTLHASVKALADVLGAVNPLAFGRASRVQRLVKHLAVALRIDNAWQYETAALLSQIGCVTIAESLLAKAYAGEELTPKEEELLESNSQLSHELLAHIPRLEEIVDSIACRNHRFDGHGLAENARKGCDLPLGSRLLKVAMDLDSLEVRDPSRTKAVQRLKGRSGWYDPSILAALDTLPEDEGRFVHQSLALKELRPEMILAEDVRTSTGRILIRKGQDITYALVHRLMNFAVSTTIQEPIRVQVPAIVADQR